MGPGKKYHPEPVVNLLQQIEVGCYQRQDDGAGIEGSRDRGADVHPSAQGVPRVVGESGEAAERSGEGEREAGAAGSELSLDDLVLKEFASGNL